MGEAGKPIITTIIPTYKRPRLLSRAINSVLKQTYPHFQLCVLDNASGDDTASVVAEISKDDPRIRYYRHSKNIGGFNNYQYGLEHVETPFFSFMSDDDILFPEFYETALTGFEKFPTSMFSATDVVTVGMRGNILGKSLEAWTPGFYDSPEGLIAILEYGYSHWIGTLFRKAVIENIGLFERELWCFDLDFVLRTAAHYPFVVSKRTCAAYNQPVPLRLSVDVIWSGWLTVIRHIKEDDSLSVGVRNRAEFILLSNFEQRLFAIGLGYLCRGNLVDAKNVDILLRDRFAKFAQHEALSVLINTYEKVPFTRSAFGCLFDCYSRMLTKRIEINQKRYRDIRPYLD